MRLILVQIVAVLLFASCQGPNPKQESQSASAIHEVVVKEAINTSSYTYLRVKEGKNEDWLAIPKMEAEVGATYFYTGGMEMKDFQSKELDRVFKTVYFLEKVYTNKDELTAPMSMSAQYGETAVQPKIVQHEITLPEYKEGITIEAIYASKEKFEGGKVLVQGQVTKFNPNIMGKNWIHLQDGTSHEGSFDLVVTTQKSFNVGDIIILKGKIALNKDFGYGYVYDVLMEDAELVK